jgi:transposase-like protein
MSVNRIRRQFSAERKAEVVRRHLLGKAPVSDLADELQVQPSLIHLWIKQVLGQAEAAFAKVSGGKRAQSDHDRRVAALEVKLAQADAKVVQKEAKLAQKNEVISELMEENVRAKKAAGAP